MTADLSTRLRTLGEAGDETAPPTGDLIERGRRRRRTRRLTGAGAVLSVAVVVTGLAIAGLPASRPSPPTAAASSGASPTDAGPVSLALAAQTTEQTSHHLNLEVRFDHATTPAIRMEGGYDPATGNAYMRSLGELRKFDEERQVGGVCWVDSGHHRWQRTPDGLCFRAGVGTKSGYFRDPWGLLGELKSTGNAQYAGRSDGVDTWNFTSEERRDTITLHYNGTVKVDVKTSRVLSIDFTESIPGQTATSTLTVSYHDYGQPVVVKAP